MDNVKTAWTEIHDLKNLVSPYRTYLCELKEHVRSGTPILMYGQGEYARIVTASLASNGISVQGFFADPGYDCSPAAASFEQTFSNFGRPVVVVLGFLSRSSIDVKISRLDRGEGRVLKYYDFGFPYPYGPAFIDNEFIQRHEQELQAVYNLLEDDLSRKVMFAFLRSKILNDPTPLGEVFTDRQYFPEDIFCFSDHEVVVDGGAFTGDTLLRYLHEAKPCFASYHAFEPDAKNWMVLQQTVEELGAKNVHLVHKGLLDRAARLHFATGGNTSRLQESGGLMIETVALDEAVPNASFIKLDIEGCEAQALEGARRTIQTNKPKLAICVYHSCQDIFEIPLLVKRLHPGYRMFLRTHDREATRECVLYATPSHS